MMFITEHITAALASTSDSPVAERLRCPMALESGVVVSSDPLFVPLLGDGAGFVPPEHAVGADWISVASIVESPGHGEHTRSLADVPEDW